MDIENCPREAGWILRVMIFFDVILWGMKYSQCLCYFIFTWVEKINLLDNKNYSRSNNVHEVFQDRWGWKWGKRNTHLRYQFENVMENSDFYENTIQQKLFNTHINDGPKKIEDFE